VGNGQRAVGTGGSRWAAAGVGSGSCSRLSAKYNQQSSQQLKKKK